MKEIWNIHRCLKKGFVLKLLLSVLEWTCLHSLENGREMVYEWHCAPLLHDVQPLCLWKKRTLFSASCHAHFGDRFRFIWDIYLFCVGWDTSGSACLLKYPGVNSLNSRVTSECTNSAQKHSIQFEQTLSSLKCDILSNLHFQFIFLTWSLLKLWTFRQNM